MVQPLQQLNTTTDDLEQIIQKITLKIAGDLNIPEGSNFLGTSLNYIEDRECNYRVRRHPR
jgi:hypothetical protein